MSTFVVLHFTNNPIIEPIRFGPIDTDFGKPFDNEYNFYAAIDLTKYNRLTI